MPKPILTEFGIHHIIDWRVVMGFESEYSNLPQNHQNSHRIEFICVFTLYRFLPWRTAPSRRKLSPVVTQTKKAVLASPSVCQLASPPSTCSQKHDLSFSSSTRKLSNPTYQSLATTKRIIRYLKVCQQAAKSTLYCMR